MEYAWAFGGAIHKLIHCHPFSFFRQTSTEYYMGKEGFSWLHLFERIVRPNLSTTLKVGSSIQQ